MTRLEEFEQALAPEMEAHGLGLVQPIDRDVRIAQYAFVSPEGDRYASFTVFSGAPPPDSAAFVVREALLALGKSNGH